MNAYDPRSRDRLSDLVQEFRTGAYLKRRNVASETPVLVAGSFFARVLEADGVTIARDWDLIGNTATYEGLNILLETGFRSGTQYTAWYAGLINNSGYTSTSLSDTMASHSGWSEYTSYSESTRRQWSPAAAATGFVVNSTSMSFTNGGASANIIGCFITSDNTKSGTSGKLWATAVESSARALAASQVFQVYYEIDLVPQS